MKTPPSSQSGFTLLELLVAVAIVAIIALVQVAPFQQTIVSRDRAEASIERATSARLALLRLSEELAGAVMMNGEPFTLLDQTLDQPSSDLRFATTGARRGTAGPQDSVEIVRYFLERDPDRPGTMLLMKEQLSSLAAKGVEPTSMVVLDGVRTFRAEALPDARSAWTPTLTAEQVPRAVRLELALTDGNAAATSYRTMVTLPMWVRS
jgi:prepilin-type N-terminal cleavage/methylation domain-containing protein